MDSAIFTLMILLTAAGADGTKVMVSIPEGEPCLNQNHYEKLEKELKEIKVLLNNMISNNAMHTTNASAPRNATTLGENTMNTSDSTVDSDRRLIGFAGGKAMWEWDRPDGQKEYGPHQAFSSSSTGRTCACCDENRPRAPLMWYEFHSAHTPARFSFQRNGADGACTPNTWRFVGSKDENCSPSSTWTELCGNMDDIGKTQIIAGTKKIVDGEEVGCDVPKYARQPFRCLGIRTYTSASTYSNDCVCLKKVKIWETGMTPVA